MSTNTKNEHILKEAKAWQQIESALDKIQDEIPKLQTFSHDKDTTNLLVSKLLDKDIQLPLDDKNKNELSIIYQRYGSNTPEFIAYSGQIFSKAHKPNFDLYDPKIKAIITKQEEGRWCYLKNIKELKGTSFEGKYSSVLIVPMRLNKKKNIGVFIFHNRTRENAYPGNMPNIWDTLSDRFAAFIRSKHRILREAIFGRIRNKLQAKLFNTECEILDEAVSLLRKNWFRGDNVYILIRNPMDKHRYFLAYDRNEIQEGFRQTQTMGEKDDSFIRIMGKGVVETLKNKEGWLIEKPEIYGSIDAECKTWLGARIQHPPRDEEEKGYNLGYFILHNTNTQHAYESGEVNFLDEITDFIALLLADFRRDRKERFIREVRNQELKSTSDTKNLYDSVYNKMSKAYGVNCFTVLKTNKTTHAVEESYKKNQGRALLKKDDSFYSNAIKKANKLLNVPTSGDINHFMLSSAGKKYLIVPMRTRGEDDFLRVIGCFIIGSPNPGKIFITMMDDLSDAVAEKLNRLERQERRLILSEFGEKVNRFSGSNFGENAILDLAHEYISKVMYSENLYIAHHYHEENQIRFPKALKNGNDWPVPARKFDPDNQGRTEWIIKNETSILIYTRKEADAWYDKKKHPKRAEHAGDALTAWLGVPVFLKSQVIAVIAVYHPTAEYVYSEYDLYFLTSIASYISNLFRVISETETEKAKLKAEADKEKEKIKTKLANEKNAELEKKNSALSSAHEQIAEQERHLVTSLLAQDITHQFYNRIGVVENNILESMDIIKQGSANKEALSVAYGITLHTTHISPPSSLEICIP